MADIILTNVLNTKISIGELFKWLTADNPEGKMWSDIVDNGSTRADFISYFLNYLREQSKSILPEVKEIQEKPIKEPTPSSPTKRVQSTSKIEDQRFSGDLRVTPYHVNKLDSYSDYKTRHSGRPVFQPRVPSMSVFSPPSSRHSVGCLSPKIPAVSNSQYPVPIAHFPPLSNQINYGHHHHHTENWNVPQNQYPGNWNPGNISQSYQISPRDYHEKLGDVKYPIDTSSSQNPALNQAQIRMDRLNLSSPGKISDDSFWNATMETNSPQMFENSTNNVSSIGNSSSAVFSPISPLFANNISALCPRRIERSPNETFNGHENFNSCMNLGRSSTPKSGTGSGQKNGKSGQNQSICLGDFMNSEGKGSKKMTRKQLKTQLVKQSHTQKITLSESQLKTNEQAIKSKTDLKNVDMKSKRRINPTRLNVSGNKETLGKEVFGVISRPTKANPKFVEAPSTDKSQEELSFEVERGLLKLERQRQPKTETTIETVNIEPKLPFKTKPETSIVPRLDLVQNIEKLDILAKIYSGILDRNLMANPMTELYFLITLLTTQYTKLNEKKNLMKNSIPDKSLSPVQTLETLKDDLGCAELTHDTSIEENEDSTNHERELEEKSFINNTNKLSNIEDSRNNSNNSIGKSKNRLDEYLGTAHNCVYFATMVMFNQQYLLSILDRTTLKLLCRNHQIATFQPELQKYLNDLYSVKCLQTHRVKTTDSGTLQTNVCFQVDTDNRETFPSSLAFTLFRKQRDLFYDILKDWEDNHLKPDWSFPRALKTKINALLTLHSDAFNYCHFAKLFISQLLVSSIRSEKSEDPMNDESLSFLKSLKHFNPEKLMQLQGRLVTPLTSMGPVPQPMFPGIQEFYREFIINAANWEFYVILETTFIREIMELNEAQFARSEIEGTETTVDESTKQNFVTSVSSLRLLAKFASFTVSLPFRSAANSPEWVMSQIQLRGRVLPSLDLKNCLLDALKHRRLSLTVPWIVQYMAMLDTVTLRLPYYVNIGELLYCIYRISNHHPFNSKLFSISSQTAILMMFTIGWLFELANFPRDLYAHWQMNYVEEKLEILDRANGLRGKKQNIISTDRESPKEFVKCNSGLDKLEIIDDRVLYECCPFLAEFKILLISGNATLGNTTANRHITPVSSQLSQPSFGIKTKNLQMQLEEAFFHGQPGSIRKTVDFVSERVASSCVKFICNMIIPSLKQRTMREFIKSKNGKIDLIQRAEDHEDKPPTSPSKSPTMAQRKQQADSMERQMEALATTIKENVKKECLEKMPNMCEARTIKSIESLLADDAFPSVKQICISVAMRLATDRIEQWIDSHIVESLFLKNMTFELRRLLKEGDGDQTDKENYHNMAVPCPTEVIEMMRNSMWELLEKKKRWTVLSVESVTRTLKCLHQTLTERSDLVEYPKRNLYTMSVEYALLLISHGQDLFTKEIQQNFLNIWKINDLRVGENEGLFARVISPRNIRLLTSTSNPSVMMIFGRLLKGLLRNDLLKIEAMSEQCVALFRQEWPELILKQLSQCLNDVVGDYKCSGAQAEGIKYLLGWIAVTCEEMEMCDCD